MINLTLQSALIVNQCIDKNEIDILFVKPKRNMKKESKRYEEEKLKFTVEECIY